VWNFPAPAGRGTSSPGGAPGRQYLELIETILSAEDSGEERMAELAFAMMLIGERRAFSPAEYRQLFTFEPDSPELAQAQGAFHELAMDHVEYLMATGALPPPAPRGDSLPRRLARVLVRLRNRWTMRHRPPIERKSEALP
jgi:hypothetical protein